MGRWTKQSSSTNRRCKSNPTARKPTTTSATRCSKKASVAGAINHYQRALQINPDNAGAQNNLAWVLATAPQASLRNGRQAMELAQRANQFAGGENPVILRTLAAAFAESGRFPEAVETAQRALQLAEAQSNPALAADIRSQLKLYQAGIPFHSH